MMYQSPTVSLMIVSLERALQERDADQARLHAAPRASGGLLTSLGRLLARATRHDSGADAPFDCVACPA